MKEKISRKELAEEGLKAIQKLEDEVKLDNIIQDNKIIFKIDKKVYRIRQVNNLEAQELEQVRRKKYLELVKDKSYQFKEQWIEDYKTKGIDIEKLEKQIKNLGYEIKKIMFRLAKTSNKQDVDKLVASIEKLREEQRKLVMKVTELLHYSIENQLTIHIHSYATYLVLEEQKGKEWKRVFDNYNAFEKSDDNQLISKAYYYVNYLMYGENYEFESSKKSG